MSDETPGLPWSEDQWAAMQQLVQDSARRARVASSFLPVHGSVARGQASVPALPMTQEPIGAEHERGEGAERLSVDEGRTLRFTTIACNVYLTTQQAEDPDLAAARDLFGRAADIIGRLEDAIIFNGQTTADHKPVRPSGALVVQPDVYTVRNRDANPGLLNPWLGRQGADYPARSEARAQAGKPDHIRGRDSFVWEEKWDPATPEGSAVGGEYLVNGVVRAIQKLEENGHYGPFACVLGQDLYLAAHTPNPSSLVLPSDRITPFLNGPLLRGSTMPADRGVVVALAGAPIDLVIGSDVHITYLQHTIEPRYVIRISERFVLRIKQEQAVYLLIRGDPVPEVGGSVSGS